MASELVSVIMRIKQPIPMLLRRSIQSVLVQNYDHLELIVIFDHSDSINDGLASAVLKEFSGDQRLKVICRNNVHGLGASMNDGILNSSGEFIAVIDHDDYWLPSKLSEQIDFLRHNNDIALLGTWINAIDMQDKLLEQSQPPMEHARIRKYALLGIVINHSSLIFRKQIIRDVGLYNTELNTGEDYEFQLRAISKGYLTSNIQKFLTNCTLRPESVTHTQGLDKWRRHYTDYKIKAIAFLRLGFRTKIDVAAIAFFPIFLLLWIKFDTRNKWYCKAVFAIGK